MGSRMAIVGVVVVILLGWSLFFMVDLEEGIEVARQADLEAGHVL
jgi:hypothetical protein